MHQENAITPANQRVLKNHTSIIQAVRDSLIMANRNLRKMRRTPEQFADVTIQPILFPVMFGYIFGGAISGNVKAYLPLLIPGILAMTVLTTSQVTGTQLREDMDKGVFNRFRSLPIARIAPLAGALIADTLRYAIAAVLTFAVGYVMGYHPQAGLGGVVAGIILTIGVAWCLSWIFAFIGTMARSSSSVQAIAFIFLFPLTFLSNSFVPVTTLPGWMQAFVKVNPISHLVSAVRQLANVGTIGHDFWYCLLGALIVVLVFAPLTVRAYMRKA
ncbi:MAG TPA: ABC transporter permease [Verrucomicrobiae bacterium]|nr:ABC transporter permease [Verrucomicrobiae bacterium]